MTIEELQKQNLKLMTDIENKDKEIETLQATITTKDTLIETNKTELETATTKITDLQNTNLELYKKVAVGVIPTTPTTEPKEPKEKETTVDDILSSL